MLKNYLKVTLRTLTKQKLYAVVNLFGLALGLACCILILRYVQYELSYDRFHEKADRIYRVILEQPGSHYLGIDSYGVTSAPMAPALVETFPEVAHATTLDTYSGLLGRGDEHFFEEGLYADPHLFEVFTFPMIRGDPATALAEPNSLVLTASLAEKIFGQEDPLGQTLTYHAFRNQEAYTVTGVVEDVPDHAHFTFTFIASILSQSNYRQDLDGGRKKNNSYRTYLALGEGMDQKRFQEKFPDFRETYHAGDDEKERIQYALQALTDIRLYSSRITFDIAAQSDIKYVYLFTAIAVFILLLACVNYMNLAVARSMKRAREVGMRKVVGAGRGQLIRQFLGESVLMAFLALGLAVVLADLLLPAFGALTDGTLRLDYADNPILLPGLVVLVLLVGLASGSYPAFFMASLRPASVLKGIGERRAVKARLQRLLIVGQYTASIVLVVGSLVIYQQLQYVQDKEIGYEREHVVAMRVRGPELRENYDVLRAELQRNPNVVAVASSSYLPTHLGSQTTVKDWEGSSEDDKLSIWRLVVDYDFFDVYGIEPVEGRVFSRAFPTDTTSAYLLNETAVDALGWASATGKEFTGDSGDAGPVVGVLNDFHMHSLHQPIQPLMVRLGVDWMSYLSVRIRPERMAETLAFLEATTQPFTPYPVAYEFVDETFDRLYETELRLGQTVGYFTALALLIACLGLFGLAAFAAEQRTKEIGIRKVMGASIAGVVGLLSKDFLKLVAAAFVLAAPMAYLAMERWLTAFAYRIDLGVGTFALAGGLALAVAVLTVSYQAVKAARADPVKALRHE